MMMMVMMMVVMMMMMMMMMLMPPRVCYRFQDLTCAQSQTGGSWERLGK